MELADRLAAVAERSQHAGDRVAFFEYCGERLRRVKIRPDPWQRRVLASESKRKLLLTSRQAGKSTTLAALALHKALFTAESLVLILAPTERQAKITFAKVARLYMAYGGQVDATSVRRMGLEFANGSQIEALPGSPNTVQGFTADLIIIDEAGIIDDELYTVMRPSLAVTSGELVMASKAYQARGVFYKEWVEGGEVWHREEVRADDPGECPRITEAFLREERQHMMPHEFEREYLCRFDEAGAGSVFGPKWMFARATDNDIPPLWDKEGQYVPYDPGAGVTEDEDVASLEQRLEELQRQLDQHRAGRHVVRESDDDLAWSWEEWQQ